MFFNCLKRNMEEGEEEVVLNPTEIQIYSGTGTYFAIPIDANILPDKAMEGFTELEEVFIPSTITKLDKTVFSSCTNLKKIVWATKSSSSKKKNSPWGAPTTCEVVFDPSATAKIVEQNVMYVNDDTLQPIVDIPEQTQTGNTSNYRDSMLQLLKEIRAYSLKLNFPSMIMIGNGGAGIYEVNTEHNWTQDKIAQLGEIMNGVSIEDVWYGTDKNWNIADDNPTPEEYTQEFLNLAKKAENVGVKPFIIDYASTSSKVDDFYNKCSEKKYMGYCSQYRDLCSTPNRSLPNENTNPVFNFSDIKNFFVLLNPNCDDHSQFKDKNDYLNKLAQSNADLLILDIFFNGQVLKQKDLKKIKHKPNGKRRQVIAYCSLGEAENYRPYWNSEWSTKMPDWIAEENKDWAGNYKVKYWTDEWKKILFGSRNSYIDTIMRLGFDGLFLDVIDAYDYFENK